MFIQTVVCETTTLTYEGRMESMHMRVLVKCLQTSRHI